MLTLFVVGCDKENPSTPTPETNNPRIFKESIRKTLMVVGLEDIPNSRLVRVILVDKNDKNCEEKFVLVESKRTPVPNFKLGDIVEADADYYNDKGVIRKYLTCIRNKSKIKRSIIENE